jgi:hypothetical protein
MPLIMTADRSAYVSPSQDLRFFGRFQRGSPEWKSSMSARTASERVNKRLLNDQGLEKHHARAKKHIFWCGGWSIPSTFSSHRCLT